MLLPHFKHKQKYWPKNELYSLNGPLIQPVCVYVYIIYTERITVRILCETWFEN